MLLLAVLAHVGGTSHPCAGGPTCMLAAWSRRCGIASPSGLALEARTTSSLLTFNVASFERSRHAHVQRVGLSTLE